MSDLKLEFATTRSSMREIRPWLEAALAENLPADLMEARWEGEVLHLFGPGAKGTVRLEAGKLVGEAKLRPPASLLRPVIEKKMSDLLQRAAT